MAGQNWVKLIEMFNYISKSVPRNMRANESNFESLAAILGINLITYTNAFSSSKTMIYDTDTVHNNTDRQLSIVLTVNKCYYSKHYVQVS